MARTTGSPAVSVSPADSVESEEVIAPETSPVDLVFESPEPEERVEWLNSWVNSIKNVEPEIIGTFAFVARQEGWHIDTPSGWEAKFSRWLGKA